jgi:purine-binding chemotaxis protein CheW
MARRLKKARGEETVSLVADEPDTLDPDLARAPTWMGALTDLFVFRLAGRAYALPATCIELVATAQAPTPVPTVPPHVRGVVHLRGRILTVIDLAAVLELDAAAADERDRRLVVIGSGEHPYGFLADATDGIRGVDVASIESDGAEDDALVRGRVDDDRGVVSILDPEALTRRLLSVGSERAP